MPDCPRCKSSDTVQIGGFLVEDGDGDVWMCVDCDKEWGLTTMIERDEILIARMIVERFECRHGDGESRGACQTIARLMKSQIPNSHLVCGYVVMNQGRAQHWWIRLHDGTIIDPLSELWMDAPYRHEEIYIHDGD